MLKNDFISALDKDKKLPQHINKPPGTTTAALSKRTQNIRKCLEIFGAESTGVYREIKTRLKNLLDTCYYIVEKQQQLKKASVDPGLTVDSIYGRHDSLFVAYEEEHARGACNTLSQ